jgi:hypothetical protein
MPARRFFSLLSEGRKQVARERLDQCDIAAIAACTPEYQEKLKESFERRLRSWDDAEDIPELEGDEAKEALLKIFGAKAQ